MSHGPGGAGKVIRSEERTTVRRMMPSIYITFAERKLKEVTIRGRGYILEVKNLFRARHIESTKLLLKAGP